MDLRALKRLHQDLKRRYPELMGLGFGWRRKGGRIQKVPAIKLVVEKKRSARSKSVRLFPRELELVLSRGRRPLRLKVHTDIEEGGRWVQTGVPVSVGGLSVAVAACYARWENASGERCVGVVTVGHAFTGPGQGVELALPGGSCAGVVYTRSDLAVDGLDDTVAQHDEQCILAAMGPLLDWLAESHRKGQAHGNIQPKTLMVSSHNYINLAFFKAATVEVMVAKSEYAPPEAYQDPRPAPTVQGDVYAVSAVLYRAISGQSPMRATSRTARKSETLPMDNVGAAFAEGLSQGLSLKPEQRPTSIQSLRELLERPRKCASGAAKVSREQVERAYGVESKTAPTPREPAEAKGGATPAVQSTPPANEPGVPLPAAPATAKRLPMNLTVGRAVEVPMAKLVTDQGTWKIKVLNGEELGVPFDCDKQALVGTPTLAGEHELRLELSLPEATGRPPLTRTIAVTVNPDPDSLWKTLPSDEKDPYFKPDTDHKDTATPYGRMIAASQRGRSHAHEGLFRDDDFRLCFDEASLWHLLAVADGAGSAKFSRRGSQIACAQALGFMEKWLGAQKAVLDAAVQAFVEKKEERLMRSAAYSWLGGAAFEARKAIQSEAEHQEPPAALRDYHTTLLLAAAKPTPAGWVITSFNIGDGGIALRRFNGEPVSLCTPDSGEFGGQTVFLTVPNVLSKAEQIMQRIHTVLVSDVSALVLMTDGVTDPKFPTEASLSDPAVWKAFWDDMNGAVDFKPESKEASEQLLKWLSFRSPGNHDDRTIALVLPNSRPEEKRS